jgi:hypothetical protein
MESHLDLLRAAERSYFLGIRNLLVLGVADVGFAPFFRNLLPDSSALSDLRTLVNTANQRKEAIVEDLPLMFKGLHTAFVDPNLYLDRLLKNPALYGITDTTVSVVMGNPAKGVLPLTDRSFDGLGAGYFFWDDISPTTRVHCNLADAIYDDVFSFHQPADDAPGLRLVELSDRRIRLYAWNLPVGQPLQLVDSANLTQFSPLEGFSPGDPCRLFTVSRVPDGAALDSAAPRRYFRIDRGVARSSTSVPTGRLTIPEAGSLSR